MVDTTEKIENSELVTNRDQLVVVDNVTTQHPYRKLLVNKA